MAFKILTENSVDNTNIDGARAEHFNAGLRDGIVKGAFNEGAFFTAQTNDSSNIIFDTCELRISGHRIINDDIWTQPYRSIPTVAERRAVIAEIVVNDSSNVSFRIFDQLASVPLIKDNLFRTENGAGTYQVEIGRFTLTTNGTITDVVRTLDVITGGSSGMGEHFIVGDITTTMLESGMQANVTAEDKYDANGNYKQTDFNFEIPETAGTVVKVNNVEQANLDFESDPQTQLNNKLDEKTGTSVVYINDEQGNSATLPYSQASNVGDAIVQRKTGGAIAVPAPSANEDAVPKSYVDVGFVPIGSVFDFAGTNAPTNYLLCNGQAVSRVEYAELFAVIGTVWGSGDGSTTFNVPNSQGKVSMGAGTNTDQNGHTGTWNLGSTGGEYNHKLKDNEMPSHSHKVCSNSGQGSSSVISITSVYAGADNNPTAYDTSSSGGNDYHNNIQPFITYNKIIRAK